MLYLLISLALTSLFYIIFRAKASLEVPTLPVIFINYVVCSIMGLFFIDKPLPQYLSEIERPLLVSAVLLGFSFITIFYILSLTTQKLGVAAGTVLSRISMVIPVLYAVTMLDEPFSWIQVIGLCLAFPAIYLSVFAHKGAALHFTSHAAYVLVAFAFFGTGLVDTLLGHITHAYLGGKTDYGFIGLTFLSALLGGIVMLAYQRPGVKILIEKKVLLLGTLLGLANYGSIYFFVKALNESSISSAVIFPLNSIGIVVLSTLLAMLIFGERLNLVQITGLVLSVSAIVLISL